MGGVERAAEEDSDEGARARRRLRLRQERRLTRWEGSLQRATHVAVPPLVRRLEHRMEVVSDVARAAGASVAVKEAEVLAVRSGGPRQVRRGQPLH